MCGLTVSPGLILSPYCSQVPQEWSWVVLSTKFSYPWIRVGQASPKCRLWAPRSSLMTPSFPNRIVHWTSLPLCSPLHWSLQSVLLFRLWRGLLPFRVVNSLSLFLLAAYLGLICPTMSSLYPTFVVISLSSKLFWEAVSGILQSWHSAHQHVKVLLWLEEKQIFINANRDSHFRDAYIVA